VAAPGDVVCVPLGCPFLIILKKVKSHYLHVGACLVDGIVTGELVKMVDQGNVKTMNFEIY